MKNLQQLQINVENVYKKKLNNLNNSELLLRKKILLETEVSEFMNEIEDHKYYKLNKKNNRTNQLEEFCDCIHVICSIANTLDIKLEDEFKDAITSEDILKDYIILKRFILSFNIDRALENKEYSTYCLERTLRILYAIAKAKGFTWEDILTGYIAVYTKNMIRAKGDY